MAWTSPRSWVAGEVVTAALMNTHLRDNLLELNSTASAWTAYTPSYNGFTVGASTAVYKQIGKTVHVLVNAELSSAVTASMRVSLPVTTSANMLNGVVGSCFGQDTSAGAFYTGVAYCATTGTLGFISNGTTAPWVNASPFTWAATDQLRFMVTYEAA